MIYGYELIKYFSENENKESLPKKVLKEAKSSSKYVVPGMIGGAITGAFGSSIYNARKVDVGSVINEATDNILKKQGIYDKDGVLTERGRNLKNSYAEKLMKNNNNLSLEKAREKAAEKIRKNLLKGDNPGKILKEEMNNIMDKKYNLSKNIKKASLNGTLAGAGVGLATYGGYKLYKHNKKNKNGNN